MDFTPGDDLETIFQLPGLVLSLIGGFYTALLGVAVFLVAFGIFKFILHADDETERKKGRSLILWGIIGIFLLLSIWGLVWILVNTVGLNNRPPPVPQLDAQELDGFWGDECVPGDLNPNCAN